MKNIIKFICVILGISLLSYFIVKRVYSTYNVACTDKNINYYVKYKGINKAVDFDKDEEGNFYIAYKNKIQFIDIKGKSKTIVKSTNGDIMSISFYKDKLYYSCGHSIYCYNIENGSTKELISSIPNFGDYKKIFIKVSGDYIYASIGSATNSGVVGNDNKWISENPYNFDITPNTITLSGINFGSEKTGAFVPYKTSNIKGQIIPNHFPGNSSVIIININTNASETFAWGIRDIEGMDFDSNGKLIAVVGGMEDRGLRPVKGDVDYIYEIKKGKWYGWPDYSGGDPVDSPKFKNKNKRILDKVPNINPPAPTYEYDKVSSLESLAVDNNGILGLKNSVFVYDKNSNSVINFRGNNKNNYIMMPNKAYIENLKIYSDGMYILDSKEGCLLHFYRKLNNQGLIINNKVFYCLIGAIAISVFTILLFANKKD